MQILLISVDDILRDLGANLCKLIYMLIASLYELFINVSSVRFLTDENIMPIYQRITLILAIIMVFYVTFQAVKYIIEPDSMSDKEKGTGKIIPRMIIVVLLIAMVPQIFSMAYTLQNSLLKNQIFSKIILGKESTNISTYGRNFSANMFSTFFYIDEEYWKDEYPDILKLECEDPDIPCKLYVDTIVSSLASTGELTYLSGGDGKGINSKEEHKDDRGKERDVYCITFHGWLAVGVGLFICYMLVLYCIDAGTRVAQLAFLQIIAPIPIIGYLAPKKDGIFEKWTKQCITTYISLFLRMIIIYVILLLTEILGKAYKNGTLLNGLGQISSTMKFFVYIALVVGLLAFAKRAPKMLEELFPKMGAASGSLGLSLKDRTEGLTSTLKGANKFRKGVAKYTGYGRRAIGGAIGFAAGAIGGHSLKAATAGAKRGFSKDDKGFLKGSIYNRVRKANAAGRKVRENREDILAAGGTIRGSERQQEHFQNVAQSQDRRVSQLEELSKRKKAAQEKISSLKFMKALSSQDEAIKKISPAAASDWEQAKKDIEKLARRHAGGEIDAQRLKAEIDSRINTFNTSHGLNGTTNQAILDTGTIDATTGRITGGTLEIDSANWRSVTVEIDAAKRTARQLRENGEGLTYTDASGSQVTINENSSTFAEDLGTIADEANTTIDSFKDSNDYREAHTNAKGSKNNSGSGSGSK